MRVLVCGGRDYDDHERINSTLDRMYGPLSDGDNYRTSQTTIITGGARGVDTLANNWAVRAGCNTQVFPAKWEVHGKAAGPIRNRQMLHEGKPDIVVAFPGGRGTKDMVRVAAIAGVKVVHVS